MMLTCHPPLAHRTKRGQRESAGRDVGLERVISHRGARSWAALARMGGDQLVVAVQRTIATVTFSTESARSTNRNETEY